MRFPRRKRRPRPAPPPAGLPPEQAEVVAWLRSPQGEQWSLDRDRYGEYVADSLFSGQEPHGRETRA
jgi:hypothetical protein